PLHDALRRRHEGKAAFRLLAEQTEIWRRVADADDALRARIRPARPDAAADKAPRHRAERLGVEVTQVDDIEHGSALFRLCNAPRAVLTWRRHAGVVSQPCPPRPNCFSA